MSMYTGRPFVRCAINVQFNFAVMGLMVNRYIKLSLVVSLIGDLKVSICIQVLRLSACCKFSSQSPMFIQSYVTVRRYVRRVEWGEHLKCLLFQ